MIESIERNRISEIVTLHNEVAGFLRMSVEKAIWIGELLTAQKDSLQHGEFSPWIKANLPFTDRTAQRYMELYQHRGLLKTDTVSDLSSATRLLKRAEAETFRQERERRWNELKAKNKADSEAVKAACGELIEYKISEAGFKIKEVRQEIDLGTGPKFTIAFECDDPKYLELEEKEASRELRRDLGELKNEMENAYYALGGVITTSKKLREKYDDQICDAYEVSCFTGVHYLWPDVCEAYKKLNKVLSQVNKAVEILGIRNR